MMRKYTVLVSTGRGTQEMVWMTATTSSIAATDAVSYLQRLGVCNDTQAPCALLVLNGSITPELIRGSEGFMTRTPVIRMPVEDARVTEQQERIRRLAAGVMATVPGSTLNMRYGNALLASLADGGMTGELPPKTNAWLRCWRWKNSGSATVRERRADRETNGTTTNHRDVVADHALGARAAPRVGDQ